MQNISLGSFKIIRNDEVAFNLIGFHLFLKWFKLCTQSQSILVCISYTEHVLQHKGRLKKKKTSRLLYCCSLHDLFHIQVSR